MRPRRVASHLARLRLSQRQDTSAATQAPCRPRVRLTRKLRCAAPRHPARRMWKQMLSVVRDGRRKSTCMLSFPICPLFSLRSENSGVLAAKKRLRQSPEPGGATLGGAVPVPVAEAEKGAAGPAAPASAPAAWRCAAILSARSWCPCPCSCSDAREPVRLLFSFLSNDKKP